MSYVWILVAIHYWGASAPVTVIERFQDAATCNATLAYLSEQRKVSGSFKKNFGGVAFACIPGDKR